MIAMYACIHIYHKLAIFHNNCYSNCIKLYNCYSVYTHQLSVHQHACSINVATCIVLIASNFVLVRNYSLQCNSLFTTEQCSFKI